METRKRVLFTPRGPVYPGENRLFPVFRRMVSELFAARGLVWRIFLRDFSARYRQSLLGLSWAVILPLFTLGIFVAMNKSGVMAVDEVGVPYPLYALVGLSIWHFFALGLSACSMAIVQAGNMVVKINFPKSTLVFAAAGQGMVELLVRVVLVALVALYYDTPLSAGGVFAGLIFLIPTLLLTLGLGFVVSLLAGLARDVVNVLNIFLFGLMLLTPVLYPFKGNSLLGAINLWNPLNYLVNVPRDLVLSGQSGQLIEFGLTSIFALLVFLGGWKFFHLAQSKIAERV